MENSQPTNTKTIQSQQRNTLVKEELAKSFKRCNSCNELHPLNQFDLVTSRTKVVYRRNVCTTCRYKQRTPEQRLLKDAKYRAKKRNLPFNLTLDDIKIPEVCPVFKFPLVYGSGLHAPSIDRIDNNRGYTKDNIVIVSVKANQSKNASTIDELKQLVAFYEELTADK